MNLVITKKRWSSGISSKRTKHHGWMIHSEWMWFILHTDTLNITPKYSNHYDRHPPQWADVIKYGKMMKLCATVMSIMNSNLQCKEGQHLKETKRKQSRQTVKQSMHLISIKNITAKWAQWCPFYRAFVGLLSFQLFRKSIILIPTREAHINFGNHVNLWANGPPRLGICN